VATAIGNKITLSPRELPGEWYSPLPDLPFELPPMMSPSGYPVTARELAPLFAGPAIEQELGRRRRYRIPKPVRAAYARWRPTPMFRAERLERVLDTPAKLFYKFEGGSPCGSYESNTAIPQAFFVRQRGFRRIITGGAGGIWVAAIGHAAGLFDIGSRVYSVRSPDAGGIGQAVARLWDIDLVPSPSDTTRIGSHALQSRGPHSGSIALALSEAYEEATLCDDAKFAMPTLLNHTVLHQTIIGLEALRQLRSVDEFPDAVIGAIGGGAHFAGLFLPFLRARLDGAPVRFVAVETASTPSLTRGRYVYDSGDSAGQIPPVKMYTLGREYVPPGIFAGGMRYHGVAPIVSALYRYGHIEAVVHRQREAFEAGLEFTRAEGLLLAPPSMYTLKEVVDEARRCADEGASRTILFSVTASAEFDTSPYDPLLAGEIEDEPVAEDLLARSLSNLPDA